MKWVKRALWLVVVAGLLLAAIGGYVWFVSESMLTATHDVPAARIPSPWPMKILDADPLGIGKSIARSNARKRGEALSVRLGCRECHGQDLGGKVVMDVGPVMRLAAPNLTHGRGGLPEGYGIVDFERMVRHGVRRDGGTALMSSIDYQALSDREVSDLYVVVEDLDPVDRDVGPSSWGPVMRALYAFGQVPALSAHRIDPDRKDLETPPPHRPDARFGEHLAQTCVGCHNPHFSGGRVLDGDPDWPPAANLTPAPDGLGGWTKEQFVTLMRTGIRPDGRAVDPVAMPWKAVGTADDVELEAIWVYLRSLSPRGTGE